MRKCARFAASFLSLDCGGRATALNSGGVASALRRGLASALQSGGLAAALQIVIALSAHAADLRTIKEPKQIATAFPAAAKLRVLNVWATWCVPCVAEMPDLRTIDDTFGSEVAITGVSLDDMIPGTKRE